MTLVVLDVSAPFFCIVMQNFFTDHSSAHKLVELMTSGEHHHRLFVDKLNEINYHSLMLLS